MCGLDAAEAMFRALDPEVDSRRSSPTATVVERAGVVARVDGRRARSSPASARRSTCSAACPASPRSRAATSTPSRAPAPRSSTRARPRPGLRALEKYAVAARRRTQPPLRPPRRDPDQGQPPALGGSIAAAVELVRAATGLPIEVECDTLDQVGEALAAGADPILLDNMTLDELRDAVALVAGRVPLEASGGVTLDTVRADRRDRRRLHLRRRADPLRPLARRLPGGHMTTARDHARCRRRSARSPPSATR